MDAKTRRRIDDFIEESQQLYAKMVKEAKESESCCGLETMKISAVALVLLVILLSVFVF